MNDRDSRSRTARSVMEALCRTKALTVLLYIEVQMLVANPNVAIAFTDLLLSTETISIKHITKHADHAAQVVMPMCHAECVTVSA